MTKVRLNHMDGLVDAVDRYIEEHLALEENSRVFSRVIKAERTDLWDGDQLTVGLVVNTDWWDDEATWLGGYLHLEYQKNWSEDGMEYTIVLVNLDEDAGWEAEGTRQEVVKWFEEFGEGW